MYALIHLTCSDHRFHFHMHPGVGNFLAEKHWDVYEYKASISLQDASGSSLASGTGYLNYGAAVLLHSSSLLTLYSQYVTYNTILLVNMLTSLFILRPWKHTAAVPILLPNSQMRQEMSPTLRPSIVKEHACIPGKSSIVAGRIDTMPCESRIEQMPGTVSTDPLEACGFSNVRSITWQSSLVFA